MSSSHNRFAALILAPTKWGPKTAISDITRAAGWHILGCDENATEQEIRLVCTSPSAPCSHLFSDTGPKDKIVRLPEWVSVFFICSMHESK